jgi:hypothetical protein
MSVSSWTRTWCSILVLNLFPAHSVLWNFLDKIIRLQSWYTYRWLCFHRIRGDQQHFVRRDELRVCDWPCIRTSFAMGLLVNYLFWQCVLFFVGLRLHGKSSLLCFTTSMVASWSLFHTSREPEDHRKPTSWARGWGMCRPMATYGLHQPFLRFSCFIIISCRVTADDRTRGRNEPL